jgi:hypothetical protein
MKTRYLLAAAILFCSLFPCPLRAEEPTPPPQSAKPDAGKPEIVTDEKNNVVRVLIGGKEILTIDAQGLHVRADVTYTGQITDTGAAR